MSLDSTLTTKSFTGNASSATAYSLAGLRYDSTSWLVVKVRDSAGTLSTLTLGTHYTLGGDGSEETGTLTSTAGNEIPATSTLIVERNTPRDQTQNFSLNSPVQTPSTEAQLDKMVMAIQDSDRVQAANFARAITVPDGETAAELPAAATRAGRFPAFDAAGAVTTKSAATILAESGGAPTGVGLPAGGAKGASLRKVSNSDHDTEWSTPGTLVNTVAELQAAATAGADLVILGSSLTIDGDIDLGSWDGTIERVDPAHKIKEGTAGYFTFNGQFLDHAKGSHLFEISNVGTPAFLATSTTSYGPNGDGVRPFLYGKFDRGRRDAYMFARTGVAGFDPATNFWKAHQAMHMSLPPSEGYASAFNSGIYHIIRRGEIVYQNGTYYFDGAIYATKNLTIRSENKLQSYTAGDFRVEFIANSGFSDLAGNPKVTDPGTYGNLVPVTPLPAGGSETMNFLYFINSHTDGDANHNSEFGQHILGIGLDCNYQCAGIRFGGAESSSIKNVRILKYLSCGIYYARASCNIICENVHLSSADASNPSPVGKDPRAVVFQGGNANIVTTGLKINGSFCVFTFVNNGGGISMGFCPSFGGGFESCGKVFEANGPVPIHIVGFEMFHKSATDYNLEEVDSTSQGGGPCIVLGDYDRAATENPINSSVLVRGNIVDSLTLSGNNPYMAVFRYNEGHSNGTSYPGHDHQPGIGKFWTAWGTQNADDFALQGEQHIDFHMLGNLPASMRSFGEWMVSQNTDGELQATNGTRLRRIIGDKPQALTDGSAIAYDCDDGLNATLTLEENSTLTKPANAMAGESGILYVTQTGAFTLGDASSQTVVAGAFADFTSSDGILKWSTPDGTNFFYEILT